MPLVRALLDPEAQITETNLYLACYEVVPAGMHSKMGQLTPGSIEFDARRTKSMEYLSVHVFLEIEAFHFEDRENLDERAESIKVALNQLFPEVGFGFAVWLKLVRAGWASDSVDPEFDGDMSMAAAIDRAKEEIYGRNQ